VASGKRGFGAKKGERWCEMNFFLKKNGKKAGKYLVF